MDAAAPIPEFTLFGEDRDFPDIAHCERIRDRAGRFGWRIAPHRHGRMAQALLLERGRAETQVDGATRALADGDFIYMPSQVVHGYSFAPGTEGVVISIPAPLARGVGPARSDLTDRLSRPIAGAAGEVLTALFQQIAGAFSETGPYRAQILAGLCHTLLARIAERGEARVGEGRLEAFKALIARHLGDGWRPADYAAALSITPGHLNRLAREGAGQSASQMIDGAVMAEACRLLAFTRLPAAEIGFRLGFGDPSYFSRRFRAVRGETPTAYRARFAALA